MGYLKKIIAGFILCFVFISFSFAQLSPSSTPVVDVSDNVLKKVAVAIVNIEKLEIQTEEQSKQVVSEFGLTEERFNEIHHDRTNQENEIEATEEELQAYQGIWIKRNELQIAKQGKIPHLIKDAGLSTDEFEQVMQVVKFSPERKKILDEFIQSLKAQ
jgi:hypothetical protein